MEVSILGRRLGVRYVSDRELATITKESDTLGFFDGNTIFISSSLTQEQSRRVFIHELAHAIFSITGLTNILEDEHEEAICDAAESLIEVFCSQEIVKFLNGVEEDQ